MRNLKCILISDLHYGHSPKTHNRVKMFLETLELIKPDLIINAGDEISNKQESFRKFWKLFRECIPTTPVISINSNHNFWSSDKLHQNIISIDAYHAEVYKEFNVMNFQETRMIPWNGVHFYGFDGWYAIDPLTNDRGMMPKGFNDGLSSHDFLQKRANSAFESIMSSTFSSEVKNVLITHFPSFTKESAYEDMCANLNWFPMITETFDYYLVGHSHQRCDDRIGKCRVLNCGSDYDCPRFIEFEIYSQDKHELDKKTLD